MGKRKRPKKITKFQQRMAKARKHAIQLVEANPTLSMACIAEHVGVSAPTVSKWFDKLQLKKWFT